MVTAKVNDINTHLSNLLCKKGIKDVGDIILSLIEAMNNDNYYKASGIAGKLSRELFDKWVPREEEEEDTKHRLWRDRLKYHI